MHAYFLFSYIFLFFIFYFSIYFFGLGLTQPARPGRWPKPGTRLGNRGHAWFTSRMYNQAQKLTQNALSYNLKMNSKSWIKMKCREQKVYLPGNFEKENVREDWPAERFSPSFFFVLVILLNGCIPFFCSLFSLSFPSPVFVLRHWCWRWRRQWSHFLHGLLWLL